MKRTIAKVPCEEILDDSLREKLYAEFKLNTDLVKKAEFTKKYDDCFIRKTNFMKVQKAFENLPPIRPTISNKTTHIPVSESVKELSMADLLKQQVKGVFPKSVSKKFYDAYGVTLSKGKKAGEYNVSVVSPDKQFYGKELKGVFSVVASGTNFFTFQIKFDPIVVNNTTIDLTPMVPTHGFPYVKTDYRMSNQWEPIKQISAEFSQALLRITYFMTFDLWDELYAFIRNVLKKRISKTILKTIAAEGTVGKIDIQFQKSLKLSPLPFEKTLKEEEYFSDKWDDDLTKWFDTVNGKYNSSFEYPHYFGKTRDGYPFFSMFIIIDTLPKRSVISTEIVYKEDTVDVSAKINTPFTEYIKNKELFTQKEFLEVVGHAAVQVYFALYNRMNYMNIENKAPQTVEQYLKYLKNVNIMCIDDSNKTSTVVKL